jgi:hypothetical protein
MDDVNTNSPDIIINNVLQILQTDKPVYIDIIHCIVNDYIEYKIQDVGGANINDMTSGNINNNSDITNIINEYIANIIKGQFDDKLVIRLIVSVDTSQNIALKNIQFIENPTNMKNCQSGFSLYKLSLKQFNEKKRIAQEEAARQLAAEEARLAAEKQRIVQEEAARLLAAEEARIAAEKQRLAEEETARQLAAAKAAEEARLAAEKQRLADEARLAAEKQRLVDEETARQLAAAAEKQRLADEETARQLAAAEEARLAAEKQRLVDEETARQLAAEDEANETKYWQDVDDTLIKEFQTILYQINEHLIHIKVLQKASVTKQKIAQITQHLNIISSLYDNLDDKFDTNLDVIRNWQSQAAYNEDDNIELIQDTLKYFVKILADYTTKHLGDSKMYQDINEINRLQTMVYNLILCFGRDKPEIPFIEKLIKTNISLIIEADMASAAAHKINHIKINEKIITHSVEIIRELKDHIVKHKSELHAEPLSLDDENIKKIIRGLNQSIDHLQHPHGNLADKHQSVTLVARLNDCINYITELIISVKPTQTVAGGKQSRKKREKPSKQTKRRDRNKKQQTHNKRTKFRRNQTRRKSK